MRLLRALLLILSQFIFIPSLFAAVAALGNDGTINLVPSATVVEDRDRKLTVSDIRTMPDVPYKKDELRFGYTRSVIWMRVFVHNTGLEEQFLQIATNTGDSIRLYCMIGNDMIKTVESGLVVPFSKREVDHYTYVFRIPPTKSPMMVIIRFNTTSYITTPVYLWTKEAFYSHDFYENAVLWIYIGILLIIAAYNILIFFSVREKTYLIYSSINIGLAMHFLCWKGIAYKLFWPESPYLARITPLIFLSLCLVAIIIFAIEFLELKKWNITLSYMIYISLTISITAIFLILLFKNNILNNFAQILNLITLTIISLYSANLAIKGIRHAQYYFLSWIGIFIFLIITQLYTSGLLLIPVISHHAPIFGGIWLSLFLSLGLADKINTMRRELLALNIGLEHKVAERTIQLEKARHALWSEMQVAKKVQSVILPVNAGITGYDVSAYMKPTNEVGGDYYDIINFEGQDWIFIGDVSGHGITAGLVMMMVQTSMQTIVRHYPDGNPALMLEAVNQAIRSNLSRIGENKFMSITALKLKDNRIEHAGCHENMLLYRKADDRVEVIETLGIWLGISFQSRYHRLVSNFSMHAGDMLLLYTDGITEACMEQSDNQYGLARLQKAFTSLAQQNPEDVIKGIMASLGPFNVLDDATLIVLKKT